MMMRHSAPARLPGITFATLIACTAFALHAIPAFSLLSPLLCAILIGLILRNCKLVPHSALPGLKYSSKTLLRAGIVLLGLRLSLFDVLGLGWQSILVIIVTVGCVYAATLMLGKAFRLGSSTTTLTATGTAICGASAIAGMSAVLKERQDDRLESAVATSIACITLCGTVAMFALPSLATFLSLTPKQAGVWIGASVHEVGQVVAAGGFLGAETTEVATVAKLGRVVLLAPLVALVGFYEAHTGESAVSNSEQKTTRPALLPLFVVGFLLTVLLRSLLSWWGLEDSLGTLLDGANVLTNFLLTLAMGALGAGIDIREVLSRGLSALGVGFLASIVAATVSLLLVLALIR